MTFTKFVETSDTVFIITIFFFIFHFIRFFRIPLSRTAFVLLQFRAMKPTAKLYIVTRILPKDRCLEMSKILCKVDHLDLLVT